MRRWARARRGRSGQIGETSIATEPLASLPCRAGVSDGCLSQAVSTAAGQAYAVEFDWGALSRANPRALQNIRADVVGAFLLGSIDASVSHPSRPRIVTPHPRIDRSTDPPGRVFPVRSSDSGGDPRSVKCTQRRPAAHRAMILSASGSHRGPLYPNEHSSLWEEPQPA